ncbi:NADH-quinone oxidoreductase subunit M [Friedmanniella endophytica]|uniref:NADH-quinone oxidoreductase subunit M n=1 Tax=Microlunatus kandeliicorticis TaxID=1759536 RepID=A0A7W3P4G5_9ACTN|nr:NADH-quinone oxidoreductase subunit M [Microlunatus kandeliicorticis]MBA8792883.1 NADH-quinone oxidoreductase subunit M [Microlunatus kandeliicorticis]
MLSLIIFLPLVVGLLLCVVRLPDLVARWVWVVTALAEFVLVVTLWVTARPGSSGLWAEEQLRWIPSVGVSYHVGVDGLSLPLLGLTAVIFVAAAAYAFAQHDRPRLYAAVNLFLQSTCFGLFAAQDLILFFVFFDLSIVAMYLVIARWGHGATHRRSALKFFLYTFLGSLALLGAFIGLFVASNPHTFDMVALAAHPPLVGRPGAATLVIVLLLIGLAVKTPTVPFHTWLPPAHTDAPTVGSLVLAAVLLKMGTYGFVRIAMPMLPESWRQWSWVIIVVGVVSVLYGALVALAQTDLKRTIAYTSVNHMGYVVLGVGVAGLTARSDEVARQIAVTGAVTQMVSHGLITGALFLLAGTFWERRQSYALDDYGGLARSAPRLTAMFGLAAFASLGLPGFSGFVAEFQIFTGSIALAPVTAVALLGILITAGLFLRALQRVFTGPQRGASVDFADLSPHEVLAAGLLLVPAVAIGLVPRPLLAVITPAAQTLIRQLGG